MVKKSRRWGGPRPAPYNPNARDADHDGMVQEGTIWERPGGSKFVDRLGKEITAAAARTSPGSYIADSDGNRIDYTPSWQRGGAPGAPGEGDLSAIGGRPSLGDLGYPSIGDTGGTIKETMGTVEGLPEPPDLTPDPRDVEPDIPDVKPPIPMDADSVLSRRVQEERLRVMQENDLPITRGMHMTIDEEMRQEIERLLGPAMEEEDIGQHLKIGPMILEMLEERGLGTHWTASPGMAETAAGVDQTGTGNLEVFFAAKAPDAELLSDSPDATGVLSPTEQELSFDDNTVFDMHSIMVRDGQQWTEVLNPELPWRGDKHYGKYRDFEKVSAVKPYLVAKADADGVSLDDVREETPAVPILSGPEAEAARQRLAKGITEGALQGSNWSRADGRGARDGFGLESAVEPVARYDLDVETQEQIEALGGTVFPVYELPSDVEGATEFRDAIQYAHDTHKFGTSVSVYDLKDYQGDIRLFLSHDKKVGYAITGDGQLVSVFNADDTIQMPLHTVVPLSLSQGATRADAFDTVLPGFYANFGLQPTARIPWDDKEKPDGWDYDLYKKYNNGRPDVVFMRFDPDRVGVDYVRGDGEYVDDYMVGLASTEPIPEVPEIDAIPGAEEAVTEAVEADAVVDRVAEAVTPITEIGATDLYRHLRAGYGGPREGSWDTLKKWGPGDSDLTRRYSMNPSGLNSKLRSGDLTPEDVEFADALSGYIGQARTERPYTVYRGLPATTLLGDIPEGEMDDAVKALVGEVVTDDGFLSASASINTASEFMYRHKDKKRVEGEESGVLMRIAVPRGAEGGLAIQSPYQEQEVLYERGTKLQVTGVSKLPNLDDREKPVYVINTELVPSDVPEGEAPPLIQEVTSFTDHDKTAPFHGLEAHLVETSRDGTVFSGFQSGAIVGRDYPTDSVAEDTLRRLIGEEVELPEGASVTASPSEALEAAAVRPGPYYKPRESSQVAMKINLPEGVDEIPEGATLRVVGVEKSQPPGMRRSADPYTPNYPAEPPTFVVEVDVVPAESAGQDLSRTATEVADDIAAVIEGTLTDRIEKSILGET